MSFISSATTTSNNNNMNKVSKEERIDCDDNMPCYLYHLGTAYLVNQQVNEAIQCFKLVVDDFKVSERDSLLRQSTYRGSFDEMNTSVLVPCMINLSTALHFFGDNSGGLEVLEEAITIEPSNVDVLNNIVVLLSYDTTPEAYNVAERYMQRALKLHKTNPRLYITYSDFVIKIKKRPLSVALNILFDGLEEVSPQDSCLLYIHIGELLAGSTSKEEQYEAVDYFELAVNSDPQNSRALAMYSVALQFREDCEKENAMRSSDETFGGQIRGSDRHHRVHFNDIDVNKDDHNDDVMLLKTTRSNYVYSGVLMKKSGTLPIWQERYCQINKSTNVLEWFASERDANKRVNMKNKLKISEMTSVSFGSVPNGSQTRASSEFNILAKTGRVFLFRAMEPQQAASWVSSLSSLIK